MRELPTVSVIIPTYKRPELVRECIESILRNDFGDFEILVVDQDPTQSLKEQLAERFNADPRIRYLFLDRIALDPARNIGIDHARGEILIFVDDDVEVDSGWLQAYVDAFLTIKPTPGAIAGRLEPLWLCPKPGWFPKEREYLLGIYDGHNELMPLPEHDLPIGANFATLRTVIDEVGLFDDRLDYSHSRRARLLSGGDSLFSLKVKQAHHSLYYQPAAKAWHKISANKLTRRYLLRRSFWDGMTLILVFYLSGRIATNDVAGILRWHVKEIGRQAWHVLNRRSSSLENSTWAQTWMRALSHCANSLGVICAACKLRLTGSLP